MRIKDLIENIIEFELEFEYNILLAKKHRMRMRVALRSTVMVMIGLKAQEQECVRDIYEWGIFLHALLKINDNGLCKWKEKAYEMGSTDAARHLFVWRSNEFII